MQAYGVWLSSMWLRAEAPLCSAAVSSRQTGRQADPLGLKAGKEGYLQKGAKTICKGVQERKQVSLYLLSLDWPAKRTGGGWMENLSMIIYGS